MAKFAAVRHALSFDAGEHRRIERVALGLVAPFTCALALALLFGWLFHAGRPSGIK